MAKIEHVFVLMMENRSFDHLLGLSGLFGLPPPPSHFGFKPGAPDQINKDPPHEFDQVAAQISGGTMTGFATPPGGGPDSMMGFSAGDKNITNLTRLANDGLLIDNWFSSMPGPTWPNRLFAHAASSGGLDDSMGLGNMWDATHKSDHALKFDNGHIFSRLVTIGKTWRVYTADSIPQVLSLEGMVPKRKDRRFFRDLKDLDYDVAHKDVANYTFIEPFYDNFGFDGSRRATSQHPQGSIKKGDDLIGSVYNSIFKQKVGDKGDKSVLVVTWDEHGGFFDHVKPPPAVPPGDSPPNQHLGKTPHNFKFDKFGVRVPALLISPWLPVGRGSDTKFFGPNAYFDHSSIVRGVRSTFGISHHLTKRDQASPDWNALLLSSPRKLTASLPKIAALKPYKPRSPKERSIAPVGPPSGNLVGTAYIAVDIDWDVAEQTGVKPLVVSEFSDRLQSSQRVLNAHAMGGEKVNAADLIDAHRVLLDYISSVELRDFKLATKQRHKR